MQLAVSEVVSSVKQVFDEWGFENNLVSDWIANDVQKLSNAFADILSLSHVKLRIERVYDNACRKFHKDNVRARLICTYYGPGTEYGIALLGEQPALIKSVPAGCPVIFKGKKWPINSPAVLLHRSPPIEGTDITRLVIVIDEGTSDSSAEEP